MMRVNPHACKLFSTQGGEDEEDDDQDGKGGEQGGGGDDDDDDDNAEEEEDVSREFLNRRTLVRSAAHPLFQYNVRMTMNRVQQLSFKRT